MLLRVAQEKWDENEPWEIRLNIKKHFFTVKSTGLWNHLPGEASLLGTGMGKVLGNRLRNKSVLASGDELDGTS